MAPLLPQRVKQGTDVSFEALYRRHVHDVFRFSLGLLGNADDAEDVTQTTFLNAYRALERGDEIRNARAWLLAIAHNLCRQRFRTQMRRPQQVQLDPEAVEAYVDEDAPTAQEIRHAMEQLAFNQRTVLVLREIEGLSYEEIAEAMELSLSAVETLLFRARRALREQLEAADRDLGCHAVERLISLQLDGKLSRGDRGLLRAHLRTCAECARLARSQRARRRVMPGLVALPLPAGLTGGFGTGGLGIVSSKTAAIAASAALVCAGALVESGVVPLPGESARAAEARVAPAPTSPTGGEDLFLARLTDPGTALRLAGQPGRAPAAEGGTAGKKRSAEPRKAGKRGAKQEPGGKQADSGSKAAGPSATGGGAAASVDGTGAAGGGTGAASSPPPPTQPVTDAVDSAAGTAGGTVGGAVGGAVGTVGGAVEEVKDTVPPLPPPPPVEPPPLPPLPPVPDLPVSVP